MLPQRAFDPQSSGDGRKGRRDAIALQISDPQAWKDICDRKTALMKAHIKRWVDEKHDVITAEDMKQALESESGYDIIRKKWAEKIFGISVPSHEEETRPACHDRPSSSNMDEH